MTQDIQIRFVKAEFLRAGPPHNQLLSPLQPYLAISGDTGAGVVTVPYEHAEFERRLKELRYETGDATDRLAMLHTTGGEMGRMLGSVPGVPGALNGGQSPVNTLIHFRITISASELALLPFEAAKVPISATATGEGWLSTQTRPPVCITRNIRTVSSEGVAWPERPRILFISGDPETVPYPEHREALLKAIKPFRYPLKDDPRMSDNPRREQFGDLLTILVNPTLTQILNECSTNFYTHVHVLAHGDYCDTTQNSFGLALQAANGSADVVAGDQFAGALTYVGSHGVHRPTVVTLATCDSGNVGTVAVPGASFAHALHQSGIPLVVASQFPLSKEGSIPVTQILYGGLLWGENPLVLLHQARARLHTCFTSTWHDWASLVVYEALPQSMSEPLETLQYFQGKRAMNAVLERIDIAVQKMVKKQPAEPLAKLEADLRNVLDRLPMNGRYHIECLGLRASSCKRRAQASFTLAENDSSAVSEESKDQYEMLENALRDYDCGAKCLLMNDVSAAQRVATLHWLLVQVASLSAVLGKAVDEGQWKMAKLCADLYLENAQLEERAWAHGSLAELYLLRLADLSLKPDDRELIARDALTHVEKLNAFYPSADEFPVKSTRRQFKRYVDWWAKPGYEKNLADRSLPAAGRWDGASGLLETAKKLVKALNRRQPSPPHSPEWSPEAPPPPDGGGPSVAAGDLGNPPGTPKPTNRTSTRQRAPAAAATLPPPSPKIRQATFLDIDLLPAGHGDSLWIEYGDARSTHRWLMDCGTQMTARELARRVAALPKQERILELFVMSHIDSDHIGGALPFLKTIREELRIGDVWFNGWRHLAGHLGARQGEIFSTAIEGLELPWNQRFDGKSVVVGDAELPEVTLPGGMKLTLLSPTPEQLKRLAPAWTKEMKRYGLEPGSRVDYTRFLKGKPSSSEDVDQLADEPFTGDAGLPNGSSIAVLAEFGGAAILLAADAHAPVLANSIRKLLKKRHLPTLKLDAFKVSHHASQNNLSVELLTLLDCPRYLISSNGDHFCHPDRQAIARIIKYGGKKPSLYFNYRSKFNEIWSRPDLQAQHHFAAHYPTGDQAGIAVSLIKS